MNNTALTVNLILGKACIWFPFWLSTWFAHRWQQWWKWVLILWYLVISARWQHPWVRESGILCPYWYVLFTFVFTRTDMNSFIVITRAHFFHPKLKCIFMFTYNGPNICQYLQNQISTPKMKGNKTPNIQLSAFFNFSKWLSNCKLTWL